VQRVVVVLQDHPGIVIVSPPPTLVRVIFNVDTEELEKTVLVIPGGEGVMNNVDIGAQNGNAPEYTVPIVL